MEPSSGQRRAGDASERAAMTKSALSTSCGISPRLTLPLLAIPQRNAQAYAHQVAEARCESPPQQQRPPNRKVRTPCRRAKVYPRLQTLEQIAERHVESMHHGEFVARSQERWESYQAVGAGTGNNQAWELESDKAMAFQAVRQSSALVIQCYWRRYAANLIRNRRVAQMWMRQQEVAAWILSSAALFTRAKRNLALSSTSLSVVTREMEAKFGGGLHYHLPASLLAWWIRFCFARASGRFLRRSPAILQALDIPVSRALKIAAQVWRQVSAIAVTRMQCAVRKANARLLMRRLRSHKKRQDAALRLQCFFRTVLAYRLVKRRRSRRAAIKIQCWWRCRSARLLATQRRVRRYALIFTRDVIDKSVCRIAEVIQEIASIMIQTSYRASRARARFRHLATESQQRSWRQNPSKGLALFQRMRYSEAALQLETCRRQGGFQKFDALISSIGTWRGDFRSEDSQSVVRARSRLSFSFSTAPLTLGSDWTIGTMQTPDRSIGSVHADAIVTQVTSYLQFWHAYALSHYFTFEATGDMFNLRHARDGFESHKRIDDALNASAAWMEQIDTEVHSKLQILSMHCACHLVKCLFICDGPGDHDRALTLALNQLSSTETISRMASTAVTNWIAELGMLSAMIYFQRNDLEKSLHQVTELLQSESQTRYSELELRFVVALLSLHQLESATKDDGHTSESERLLKQATQQLQRCYQIVEMWPGVGFYHGEMSTAAAKSMLSTSPEGSFLLHHTEAALVSDDTRSNCTNDGASAAPISTRVLMLEVALGDQIASMKIDFEHVLYDSRKLLTGDDHFSLHQFVEGLPSSAGIVYDRGVRKELYLSALRRKLQNICPNVCEEKEVSRRLLMNWGEWERALTEVRATKRASLPRLRNETWGCLCLEVAKILESSHSWTFSLVASQEALSWSRDRSRRASAYYLCARIAAQLHQQKEVNLYTQHARLEAGIVSSTQTRPSVALGLQALVAVDLGGGLLPSVYRSKRESFEAQLDRVSKLDRMCLKAWQFDSLASGLRGDPFNESLLLQRVQDEMYSDCGDTFFLRSLLKAHVRAYLNNGRWYEDLHLELAFDCATRLVNKFFAEQRQRQHNGCRITAQLSQMITHCDRMKSAIDGGDFTRHFRLERLLLSWHHLPFSLCFEIAETLYRLSAYQNRKSSRIGLIDIYQSLYGRLRGSKPRTMMYSSYEELLLFRMAFLHASNVKESIESMRHFESAIECINEILQLRKQRAAVTKASDSLSSASQPVKSPWLKKITWPTLIRVPIELSDAELAFVRGFLLELGENMLQTPEKQRKSWSSYRPLHDETISIVANMQARQTEIEKDPRSSPSFLAAHLRALRVYIGCTQYVDIPDVLRSKPYVTIWCEGGTFTTQMPPTWTDLSPSWDEYVEFDVKSPSARLVINLMNRHGRFSIDEPKVIGSTTVFVRELLEADTKSANGRFYPLRVPNGANEEREGDEEPRLFLNFQVILDAKVSDAITKARSKRMPKCFGLWDLSELRANLHGDFRTFVTSPWIWSRFAELFQHEHEFAIASWFYHKASACMQIFRENADPEDLDSVVPAARNLIGLAICQRALMCKSDWNLYGRPQVEYAAHLLRLQDDWTGIEQAQMDYKTIIVEKEQAIVRMLLSITNVGPLERALALRIPASSQWIKIPHIVTASAGSSTRQPPKTAAMYFFNQDTGECVLPHFDMTDSISFRSQASPLEYEGEETIANHVAVSLSWQPRGVIIMTPRMKQRVTAYQRLLEERYRRDPFKWIAIFNARRQEMQFFSQSDPNATCGGTRRQKQPPTYVLVADSRVLYHVLVIQDSFRQSQRRRQLRRLGTAIMRCTWLLTQELLASRRRLFERSEISRKSLLNCIYVHVERAHHLRAGDLITSDPYAVLSITDRWGQVVATGTTSVRHNTRNPKWNEEFFLPYDFATHEQSELMDQSTDTALCDACLTILVLDYDLIKMAHAEDDCDLPTGISRKDFLGRTMICIDAFQHGKRMTADLELNGIDDIEDCESDYDENGQASVKPVSLKKKAQSRGTVTITMQWIHFDDPGWKRRPSANGRYSIVEPLQSASREKSPVPAHIELKLQVLRDEIQPVADSLHNLIAVSLDPLSQLHTKMTMAQTSGRTAEEAKVHEMRMGAIVSGQLAPHFLVVQQKLQSVSGQLESFREEIRATIMTHIEEVLDPMEANSAREEINKLLALSSPPPSTCTATAAQATSLAAPARGDPLQTASSFQPQHQETLLLISIELRAWTVYLYDHIQYVSQLLAQFFFSDETWLNSTSNEVLQKVASRLSTVIAQLAASRDASAMNRGDQSPLSNIEAAILARQVDEKQRQEKEKAADTLAKRKERLERENRKHARK